MIVYSVTVAIEPASEPEWIEWMTQTHVPEVLQTGCFTKCRIHKVIDPEMERPTYMLEYRAVTIAEYLRYRDQFSAALQKQHSELFQGRFSASRQILEEVAEIDWPDEGAVSLET